MNGRLTSIPLIVLLAALTVGPANAQENTETDELGQLLELLNQQTTLATQSRLNADFVPGMISVLNAEQLRRRGFRTLWQALDSLPGVITLLNETGRRNVFVRGIGEQFDSGKVKLLLNGEAINASASATTGTLLETPIDQIERVEFIRGPGSAVHGEFAYAGVLNVITAKRGGEYSAGLDTNDSVNFSLLRNFAPDGEGYRIGLNLAASQSDGEDIDSGRDRTVGTMRGFAPGPINNPQDFFSAIVDFEAGDWHALLQLQQGRRGDYFGSNNLLPPDEQTVITDSLLSAMIGQDFAVRDGLIGKWSLSAVENDTEKDGLFLGVAEVFGGFSGDDDITANSRLKERRVEGKLSLRHDGPEHKLFAELSIADVSVQQSETTINLDPITNLPATTQNEFPAPVDTSQDRSSSSLVLQDEYRIDDTLTLTSGLRWDDYEDIGHHLSPRIALVWRYSDEHVFKAQLARAFRPPSLIETGGSIEPTIDPEINDTLEFGYIYQRHDLVLRNTLYFTRLDDLIVFQDTVPFGYRNSGSEELTGYELELERTLDSRWEIVGSLSLQDYADAGLPGAPPWMLKLGVGYQLMPLTRIYLQLNSIGSRDREDGDSRGDFDQTTQLDLSFSRQMPGAAANYSYHLGILNLLDERLEYPSPADTYAGDYPYRDGATLWFQFRYQR